jgi:hypothetical protein
MYVKNLTKEIKMRPLPSYGNLITLKSFLSSCKNKFYTDYDGYGYYSNGKEMSDELITPSKVLLHANTEWSHVMWFNR